MKVPLHYLQPPIILPSESADSLLKCEAASASSADFSWGRRAGQSTSQSPCSSRAITANQQSEHNICLICQLCKTVATTFTPVVVAVSVSTPELAAHKQRAPCNVGNMLMYATPAAVDWRPWKIMQNRCTKKTNTLTHTHRKCENKFNSSKKCKCGTNGESRSTVGQSRARGARGPLWGVNFFILHSDFYVKNWRKWGRQCRRSCALPPVVARGKAVGAGRGVWHVACPVLLAES